MQNKIQISIFTVQPVCQVDDGSRISCQQGDNVPADVAYCALTLGCCWVDGSCYLPTGYTSLYIF